LKANIDPARGANDDIIDFVAVGLKFIMIMVKGYLIILWYFFKIATILATIIAKIIIIIITTIMGDFDVFKLYFVK
jgi:hypothetical protein